MLFLSVNIIVFVSVIGSGNTSISSRRNRRRRSSLRSSNKGKVEFRKDNLVFRCEEAGQRGRRKDRLRQCLL